MGDSVNPVLCWDRQGKGTRNSFPLAGTTIMDIRAVRDGAIAFCSADGESVFWTEDGTVRWRSAPDLLDYRVGPSFPHISRDGNRVETASDYFNGTAWTRHNIRFSVSDQKLEIDTKPNPHYRAR